MRTSPSTVLLTRSSFLSLIQKAGDGVERRAPRPSAWSRT